MIITLWNNMLTSKLILQTQMELCNLRKEKQQSIIYLLVKDKSIVLKTWKSVIPEKMQELGKNVILKCSHKTIKHHGKTSSPNDCRKTKMVPAAEEKSYLDLKSETLHQCRAYLNAAQSSTRTRVLTSTVWKSTSYYWCL